jgi:hypothetical protein
MKKIGLISLSLLLFASVTISAQNKKVAVVSFGINRSVGTSNLSGAASMAGDIAAVANDPNFNLKPILDKFYKTFFEEYSKELPFELIPDNQVIGNEQYKAYKTIDTTSLFSKFTLLKEGYNYLDVSALYKKDIDKMVEIFENNADGFIFINITFEFSPKVAIGGMGTAAIYAYASMKIWNNKSEKVVNIYEGAVSKKSVSMVAGIPLCKTDKILPLCEEAADQLIVELKTKLPKIAKKSAKNL